MQWLALIALAGFITFMMQGWFYAAVVVVFGVLIVGFVEGTSWLDGDGEGTDRSSPHGRPH